MTEEVLNRESIRTSEIFVALGAAWTFGEACQESISNQAGIGNEDQTPPTARAVLPTLGSRTTLIGLLMIAIKPEYCGIPQPEECWIDLP